MWRSAKTDLARWRSRIFVLTWITYASFYLCRKNFSVAMPLLNTHVRAGNLDFANIIFAYSLMYTVGQVFFGWLSDKYGARIVVTSGMCVAAAANIAMAFYSSTGVLFALMILNGVGQSAGWPGLVQMMANWFTRDKRGVVMSWWTTNYVLGGFLATVFAAYIATNAIHIAGTGLQHIFWVPAVILLSVAVVFSVGTRNTPEDAGLELQSSKLSREAQDDRVPTPTSHPEEPFFHVLTSPVVLVIACGCLFSKITRYAFLFWLPLYMTQELGYKVSEAGYTSGVFELSGFVGALMAGYISDKVFGSRRFPVSACMFWMLATMCLLQPILARHGYWLNLFGIAMIGIANYGPDTLLQGAASQDVGSRLGTGKVSGWISGVGSIGQLTSPYLVAVVAGRYGWNVLFHVFTVVAFVGGVIQASLWRYNTCGMRDQSGDLLLERASCQNSSSLENPKASRG
jgi:OPA family sugar phosphate sensor protein UhpC-like MFS transporter